MIKSKAQTEKINNLIMNNSNVYTNVQNNKHLKICSQNNITLIFLLFDCLILFASLHFIFKRNLFIFMKDISTNFLLFSYLQQSEQFHLICHCNYLRKISVVFILKKKIIFIREYIIKNAHFLNKSCIFKLIMCLLVLDVSLIS